MYYFYYHHWQVLFTFQNIQRVLRDQTRVKEAFYNSGMLRTERGPIDVNNHFDGVLFILLCRENLVNVPQYYLIVPINV